MKNSDFFLAFVSHCTEGIGLPWACLQYSAINTSQVFVVMKRCQDGQGFAYFSIRACFHSSHVVQSLTALTNTEFIFSKPDAPLRTAQWDRARLAQFCSCPLPQASKNAKSIRIYQKILQFNLAHLIEIIFLQIFPQSISFNIEITFLMEWYFLVI